MNEANALLLLGVLIGGFNAISAVIVCEVWRDRVKRKSKADEVNDWPFTHRSTTRPIKPIRINKNPDPPDSRPPAPPPPPPRTGMRCQVPVPPPPRKPSDILDAFLDPRLGHPFISKTNPTEDDDYLG